MTAFDPDRDLATNDVGAVATLSLLGLGVPLWLSSVAGAIGLPGNDDWVYRRATDSLFGTGVLDMPGHTASAIGQIVLVQPFL